MNNGDIYFWSWKDSDKSYHCKSRKAIVKDGVLLDTYWWPPDYTVTLDGVDLTYKGNIYLLDEIRHYDIEYYRPEDVVDMRHPNSSTAKVFVRAGAKRDALVMKEVARLQIERSQSEIRMATARIKWINEAIAAIDDGQLDSVDIPVCRV